MKRIAIVFFPHNYSGTRFIAYGSAEVAPGTTHRIT